MAEFCIDCWNKINESNDPAGKYILSKELDFCEGCKTWKHVVIIERKYYYLRKYRIVILPFRVLYKILWVIWRLPTFPYWIYKYRKELAEIKND